jgi:hypothetical protein
METVQRLSPVLGLVLLFVAAVDAIAMFEVLGRRKPSPKLRLLHRLFGWIYLSGLAAFFIFMFPRAAEFGKFSPQAMFHAYTGMVLVVLATAKALVARRYKAYAGTLPGLGFSVLLCTFLVIMLTSGEWVAQSFFK